MLKHAFRDMLPDDIRRRPKMGFGVPVAEWLRGDLRPMLDDLVLSKRALDRGYFDRAAVRALADEHVRCRYDHGYRLWSLLWLELWHRTFIDPADAPASAGV